MKKWFHVLATKAAHFAGSPYGFLLALTFIVVWFVSGPLFGFSDTWQLVINTSTTIITFLMVFLIQHTQNVGQQKMERLTEEIAKALPTLDNSKIEEIEEDLEE